MYDKTIFCKFTQFTNLQSRLPTYCWKKYSIQEESYLQKYGTCTHKVTDVLKYDSVLRARPGEWPGIAVFVSHIVDIVC